MDTELSQLKQVNIEAIAQSIGYARDKAASTPRVAVIRRDAEKLLVTNGRNGPMYRNERDHQDQGDAIDFVTRHMGLNLGQARQFLRSWAGTVPTSSFHPAHLEASTTDYRKKSHAVWNAAVWNPEHPYLLHRGLSAATLADPRFHDTYRQDKRGNVIFPHRDREGLCGYELRNHDFKGFGEGCKKGLWHSNNLKIASAIVITEAVIDALSHSQLYGWDVAYVALGGAIGARQRDLLVSLLAKAHARSAMVIIATDNDEAGESYFDQLKLLAPMKIKRHRPISKDWNCDLVWCNRENGGGE